MNSVHTVAFRRNEYVTIAVESQFKQLQSSPKKVVLFCICFYGVHVIYCCSFTVGKISMSHVKLIFWDLGGQQELQSLWDKVL